MKGRYGILALGQGRVGLGIARVGDVHVSLFKNPPKSENKISLTWFQKFNLQVEI